MLQLDARRGEPVDISFSIPGLAGSLVENWTPAIGDVKISIGSAAPVNTANLPSYLGNKVWSLSLTADEMDAGIVVIVLSKALLFEFPIVIQAGLFDALPKGRPPAWNKLITQDSIKDERLRRLDPTAGRR